MKYLLLDSLNMFYRARHTSTRGTIDDRVGLSLHITLSSIASAWQRFNSDHLIVFSEGRSWRKDYYKPYKANRAATRAAMSAKEQEEDALFHEVYTDLLKFFEEKTNVTVLQHPTLEADDLIAGFIQQHPDDEHLIISSDSDFYQLLSETVSQYNGVTNQMITIEGIFDDKGNPVLDKKTKQPKDIPDPKWLLFEKCVRGDSSDNVMSAYPGVRKKGSKNKVGMLEAYTDMNGKGYDWNNFMLQRWTDHLGEEHRVKDDYERNRTLIDLSAQPKEVRTVITEVIGNIDSKDVRNVGIHFMKFCGAHDLQRMAQDAQKYGQMLSARYPQE